MTGLFGNPVAVGWKKNHEPGLRFHEHATGKMELTNWPSALGPLPSQADLDAWNTEYLASINTPTKISWKQFNDRFKPTEAQAAMEYAFQTDLITGKPIRPVLQQKIHEAIARDWVELTAPTVDTYLQDLVTAGILTALRKTQILDPAILTPP